MPLNKDQQKYIKDVAEAVIGCAESDATVSFTVKAGKSKQDFRRVSVFHQQALKVAEVLVGITKQLVDENKALQAEIDRLNAAKEKQP